MQSTATTVEEYIYSLPADKTEVIRKVRKEILDNLPDGYVETMEWGMITYQIPLSVFPDTYNKRPLMYAALASQKNYFSIYLTVPYAVPKYLQLLKHGFDKAGKKLNMGKSCIRFKKLDDIPLDVIGDIIASVPPDKFITVYKSKL